jgi:hypothetical protein
MERSREIVVPPLCAVCLVGTEIDEADDGTVIQRGLRRIDRVDGGLTRRRWEKKKGDATRVRTASPFRRVDSSVWMISCSESKICWLTVAAHCVSRSPIFNGLVWRRVI